MAQTKLTRVLLMNNPKRSKIQAALITGKQNYVTKYGPN